ncbi:hypothetical protein BH23ACT9_BH23ACT9_00360 [soil metagenome]
MLLAQAPDAEIAQAADPDAIRRTTADVLSQADYGVGGGPTVLDRVIGWVLEQLGRLLLRFDGDGGTGSVIAGLVLVVAVGALLTVAVVFLRRLRRGGALEHALEGPAGRPPRSWADEAERHEREGDLRQALRCRYRETVAMLATAGLIEEIPGRTTGEYARAVAVSLPAAQGPFDRLTHQFDDIWYGGRPVDADVHVAFRDDQDAVATAAGTRRRQPAASRASGASGAAGA